MHPRNSPGADHSDAASAARARLAAELRKHGRVVDSAVLKAFARVPRHVFVPEVGPAAAYRDEALVIKCGADGLPISSSSQPAMMAIMLDQLGLAAGHRVLEIGTGSGYNAAVMSEVVGASGEVVSIDIDPELVARASASLAKAGYHAVVVKCADGGFGDPDGAPFDRIIVTAGAWDIAPAWLTQVGPGGLLVLPLSVRGIQLSVALQRIEDLRGERAARGAAAGTGEPPVSGLWQSTSAWRCGFVRMLGAFAGPEEVLRLDEELPLFAQMADGRSVDGSALQTALASPAAEQVVPLSGGLADLADLDLWLTLTAPVLDRVTLLAAPGGWFELASLLPLGGLVVRASGPGLGVAVLLPAGAARDRAPSGRGTARSRPGLVVRGYGPGGDELAAYLAERAGLWAHLGRPGVAEMSLAVLEGGEAVRQHGAVRQEDVAETEGSDTLVLVRPSATIEIGWPG
jgi:protein-L-isoaspartate(D-aspartate) O-methyltransferase